MDLVKTLQSIEDVVYEIVVWIYLLPRTFLKLVFNPAWIQVYVTKEWKKTPENRFSNYLSPVIAWLLIAVIPFAVLTFVPLTGQDYSNALDEKNLFRTTLFVLASPLVYFAWIQKILKKPFDKAASKRLFFIQCYSHAPVQFVNVLINIFTINTSYFIFLSSAMIFWLWMIESFVFRDELKISFFRSTAYAFVPQIFLFIIAVGFLTFFDKSGIVGALSVPPTP